MKKVRAEALIAALGIHLLNDHDGEIRVSVTPGLIEVEGELKGTEIVVRATERPGAGLRLPDESDLVVH